MGFFGKLFSGISKAASAVANVASKAVEKTVEIASAAVDKFIDVTIASAGWVVDKLSGTNYDSNSIESRKGVEQALASFRSEISEQAREAEEASIYSAMSRFDEFADTLEESFPELVDLVRTRQADTEKMLSHTIINYVQEHISENDPKFQELLEMEAGEEKKRKMSKRMNSIIEDAQDYFGRQLKQQIQLLNDELDVRLDQKINAQEELLKDTEERYRLLTKQQSSEALDIQKIEEECVPVAEAASCIQLILEQEDKNELMVSNRSGRPKSSRKPHGANRGSAKGKQRAYR